MPPRFDVDAEFVLPAGNAAAVLMIAMLPLRNGVTILGMGLNPWFSPFLLSIPTVSILR